MPDKRENQDKDNQDKLLRGLQQGASWAIEQLYRTAYPQVAALIKSNSGTEADAQDIFQDALVALIPKLRLADFEIKAAIGTYLYAIARNQWLTKIRKNKKNPIDFVLDEPATNLQLKAVADFSVKDHSVEKVFWGMVLKCLKKLGADCQKIIQLKHMYKYSHEEIVEEMDAINSLSYSRLRLNNCMQQLRKCVKETPTTNH